MSMKINLTNVTGLGMPAQPIPDDGKTLNLNKVGRKYDPKPQKFDIDAPLADPSKYGNGTLNLGDVPGYKLKKYLA